MSDTANNLITNSLLRIGVLQPGEEPEEAQAQFGLRVLNQMMRAWQTQVGTIPVIAREVFSLTANKGSVANPYTIGATGNLVTTRPTSIAGAGLLLAGTAPRVEIPRAVLTDDAWQAIQVKDLSNALFTAIYYNPTFTTSELGTINLWPVPDNALHSLILYRPQQLSTFANLSTSYQLPPGYEEAIELNLAMRCCVPFARLDLTVESGPASLPAMARSAFAVICRANVKMTDMPIDASFTHNRRGGYNIDAGTGG